MNKAFVKNEILKKCDYLKGLILKKCDYLKR